MIIQYNIVVSLINLIDNSTVRFDKTFNTEVTAATDDLLYNNYHVLSENIYILDMFTDEVNEYCESLSIEPSSVEIDEFEIVSITDRADVFFEAGENNELSLSPVIKCYIYPKNDALPVPTLQGVAYDAHTIIWSWPGDENYAHYLITEACDPTNPNEDNTEKIIAQIPIGATSYTETNLYPDTAYTRRLINYTAEQTSTPSAAVTVQTETVPAEQSLEEYKIPKNYDFTTDDKEREIIEERLEAFHSGIGDYNDLKVYKQMDGEFYQKFKAYFEITGSRIEREKHYEQVGFNYKVCLEAIEQIEEQEGEVTFDVDAYPIERVDIKHYMYSTIDVHVWAKLYATIFLRKEDASTVQVPITIDDLVPLPPVTEFYGDPLNIVFMIDITRSMASNDPTWIPGLKQGIIDCLDAIEAMKGTATVRYKVGVFAGRTITNHPLNTWTEDINAVKNVVNGLVFNEYSTNWGKGLIEAKKLCDSAPDGKCVTYFFSDGLPNTFSYNNAANQGSLNYSVRPYYNGKSYVGLYEDALLNDLIPLANALKTSCERVACCAINHGGDFYSSDGIFYSANFMTKCQQAVATDADSIISWTTGDDIKTVFLAYIDKYTNPIPGGSTVAGTGVTYIDAVSSIDKMIAVEIESETLGPFTFTEDPSKPGCTPIYYDTGEKRAKIDPVQIIQPFTTKMTGESVYDILLRAAQNTPEWAAGYNKTINSTNGGFMIAGLFIKDTFTAGDEDTLSEEDFDARWDNDELDYGRTGTINVYTKMAKVDNSFMGDDCYLVQPGKDFVYIDGYTDGIIYDGTRFYGEYLNAYDHPTEILVSKDMDYTHYLFNRKNRNICYKTLGGDNNRIRSVVTVLWMDEDIYIDSNPPGLPTFVDVGYFKGGAPFEILKEQWDTVHWHGWPADMVAHNDTVHESPILNYRFNIEDPDAKTPLYEILPTCNPYAPYHHIVHVHIYYARNIWITDMIDEYYIEAFGDDPIATTSSEYYPLIDGMNSWERKWIDEYIWFMAKPMIKTQKYYDELPGKGMDVFYGLVNGRYKDNNQSGKQDLIVDTPQFNIPTTVLPDTVQIYILITEYVPDTALVSYKWDNPYNDKDNITQVNGDYVTFSSDSITYKDVKYDDILETINMENQELFDNKTTELIYEIEKPETFKEYEHYYLSVTTDNADVLAMRYPTEIFFEDGRAQIPVSFKGVVNATSQWAPRIHNGYYYLNQHEHFAYSKFEVDADFVEIEEENFKTMEGYITFDVVLKKDAAPPEDYHIVKDSRSELIQDEDNFIWINDKGLTLKPTIDTQYYKEYETQDYISPVILFPNILTEAKTLTLKYYFEDGSDELEVFVRSYIMEEGKWSDWIPLPNESTAISHPDADYSNPLEYIITPSPANNIPLSCAYQIKTQIQASVIQDENEIEDYLCCYLDWQDDVDERFTTNIVTATDHMETGPDDAEGIFISKIIDCGCETEINLSIFESAKHSPASLSIAYSNNENAMLIENLRWLDITLFEGQTIKARYFRYRINIPAGEKVYWLHKQFKTYKSRVWLPYIVSVEMEGHYEATEEIRNFINTESFTLVKDGEPHEICSRIIDVIGADVIVRGFTHEQIQYVKISSTTPSITLEYAPEIEEEYPLAFLETGITATAPRDIQLVLTKTPFIKCFKNGDRDTIEIIGTPQQYCPITLEDEFGNSYLQIYDVDPTDMMLTETFILTDETKYIELNANGYELSTLTVYVNDVIYPQYITNDNGDEIAMYEIVNHLIIFAEHLPVNTEIKVTYRHLYSFHADVNRDDNITTLTIYSDENWDKVPASWTVETETTHPVFTLLTLYEMFITGEKFSTLYKGSPVTYIHADTATEKAWTFETTKQSFETSANSFCFNGFISGTNSMPDSYSLQCTLKSDDRDDDTNGLVVGALYDTTGNWHNLSLVVQKGGNNIRNLYDNTIVNYSFALIADCNGYSNNTVGYVIKSFTVADLGDDISKAIGAWSDSPNGIRVSINKNKNTLTCKCSYWDRPDEWNPASEFTIDLLALPETAIFADKVHYGYCNYSQSKSYYEDIGFEIITEENIQEHYKKYKVFFETDKINNKFIANELSLNPIYRTDYKGFIYLTDDHNDPYSITFHCNPTIIKAGGFDKVDVSVEVLDVLGNPIIAKQIALDCNAGKLIHEEFDYITDMNGVVHVVYESSYVKCTDIITARVLKDDGTMLEQTLTIINE